MGMNMHFGDTAPQHWESHTGHPGPTCMFRVAFKKFSMDSFFFFLFLFVDSFTMFPTPFPPATQPPPHPRLFYFSPASWQPCCQSLPLHAHCLCRDLRGHLGDEFLTSLTLMPSIIIFLDVKGALVSWISPLGNKCKKPSEAVDLQGAHSLPSVFNVRCATWIGCSWKSWGKFFA